MYRATIILAVASLATVLNAAATNELAAGKDLKATIALNGQPCDQIINVRRNADSDYVATCKDGNRYHVFVNPQGRVIVERAT